MFLTKKPRILQRVQGKNKKEEPEPVSLVHAEPERICHHWWEDEEIEEVPWAKSLEYLRLELKLKNFGQYTSVVYRSGRLF